jgi:phosphatidylglycerophosphatase C
MKNIIIFDLDYTLTKKGTWGRFVLYTVKYKPWIWLPLILSAGFAQWRYKAGYTPRISVKQSMMKWSMAGHSKVKMERLADEFAKNEVLHGLRPGAIEALNYHKSSGDIIIIASAAVDLIVKPVAELLKIDYWVATNMRWINNFLSEGFESKNCYGSEKLERVKQLLENTLAYDRNETFIKMYTDSISDIDILRFSDEGVAVNPDRKLAKVAIDENFELVNWN